MAKWNDDDLLNAFAQSFAVLDELICPHDRPPPRALIDSTASEEWSVLRWRPQRLASRRVGIESLRRAGRLPQLLESFAKSFAWLDVNLGVCRLFANPPAADCVGLSSAMFADSVLNNTLLPLRLVRFALAADDCYDPICFDLSTYDGDDCQIVQIDHESLLMCDRVGKCEVIFKSFRGLMRNVIEAATLPPKQERLPEAHCP